jgi:hypothetical protein
MRYLAAGSAYLAPPLLLASDVLLIQFISEPGLLVQRIALIVFVPGIAAAAALGHGRARWFIAVGAMLAILGLLAIVVRQSVLAAPLRPPAVLFPRGLVVMSVGMISSVASRRIAALLAAGALLFPFAHLSGAAVALISSDVGFLAAFWLLALSLIRHYAPAVVAPARGAAHSHSHQS